MAISEDALRSVARPVDLRKRWNSGPLLHLAKAPQRYRLLAPYPLSLEQSPPRLRRSAPLRRPTFAIAVDPAAALPWPFRAKGSPTGTGEGILGIRDRRSEASPTAWREHSPTTSPVRRRPWADASCGISHLP